MSLRRFVANFSSLFGESFTYLVGVRVRKSNVVGVEINGTYICCEGYILIACLLYIWLLR